MLPDSIVGLPILKFLRLSNNKFTEVPQTVLRLPALTSLYFAGNLITNIQSELFSIPQIKELDFAGNFIAQLPNNITPASTLTLVRFSYNKITFLPQAFIDLSKRCNLVIDGNYISQELPTLLQAPANFVAGRTGQMQLVTVNEKPLDIEVGAKIDLDAVRHALCGVYSVPDNAKLGGWQTQTGIFSIGNLWYRPIDENVSIELFDVTPGYLNNDGKAVKLGKFCAKMKISYADQNNSLTISSEEIQFSVIHSRNLSLNNFVESLAREQTSIASIINSETAKVDRIALEAGIPIADLTGINNSVESMVEAINKFEVLCRSKLKIAAAQLKPKQTFKITFNDDFIVTVNGLPIASDSYVDSQKVVTVTFPAIIAPSVGQTVLINGIKASGDIDEKNVIFFIRLRAKQDMTISLSIV